MSGLVAVLFVIAVVSVAVLFIRAVIKDESREEEARLEHKLRTEATRRDIHSNNQRTIYHSNAVTENVKEIRRLLG